MATLLSASQPPSSTKSEGSQPAILSPDGKKRYFIVHGGLFSKDGVTLDDVKKIDRYGKQPGQEGLMCELLWTDPQDAPGRGPSKRGVGVGFGPDVTKRWCEANQVTAVIRSHEVRQNGYAIEHGESAVGANFYVEKQLVLTGRSVQTDSVSRRSLALTIAILPATRRVILTSCMAFTY
jgi:diadenosine tetraphosphatase ApaH/serine/threonine PP2A family protein phosphatase